MLVRINRYSGRLVPIICLGSTSQASPLPLVSECDDLSLVTGPYSHGHDSLPGAAEKFPLPSCYHHPTSDVDKMAKKKNKQVHHVAL